MGKIKKRIYPRDITINIGKGEPIPEHPYPGQTWKEVRHDQTVTWLAYWKDTVSDKDYKVSVGEVRGGKCGDVGWPTHPRLFLSDLSS